MFESLKRPFFRAGDIRRAQAQALSEHVSKVQELRSNNESLTEALGAAQRQIADLSSRVQQAELFASNCHLINASRSAWGDIELATPRCSGSHRRAYDSVVSLGAWCQTSEQLRLHRVKYQSGPFDWGFTAYPGLKKLIENEFVDIYDRKNLYVVGDGWSIGDNHYGLVPHHLFSRLPDGKACLEIVDREYDTKMAKVRYLIDKWNTRTANAGLTLYVWSIADNWLYHADPKVAALDIQETLGRKYPGHEFHLLVIQEGSAEADWDTPGIFNRYVRPFGGPYNDLSWSGDFDAWTVVLQEFRTT